MMQTISVAALADLLHGEHTAQEDVHIAGVSKDTRDLSSGEVYVAIRGEQFDGHDFVGAAADAGACAALVSEWQASSLPQIKVADTLQALGNWAAWNRQQFLGPVVAVTGSAGKTSTKALIHHLLSTEFSTLVTQGNLNNHIGVPLTLLSISAEHQAAVVELGASAVGEIAHTAQWVQPTIAVITNAAEAHLAGFGSLENVVLTKGELLDYLPNDGLAVLNADDPHFAQWQARAQQQGARVVSFGFSEHAQMRAVEVQSDFSGSYFSVIYQGEKQPMHLPLLGEHSVLNALAAVVCAEALGISLAQISQALKAVDPVAGRLQTLVGQQGQVLINDAYNANPRSVRAAIDLLVKSPEHWLVLGDMGELGEAEQSEHRALGVYAKAQGVKHLLATGRLSLHTVDGFGEGALWFANKQELTDFLQRKTQEHEVVLVKGSRSAGMDWVVSQLQKDSKVH